MVFIDRPQESDDIVIMDGPDDVIIVDRLQEYESDTEIDDFNWIEESDKENTDPKARKEFSYKERIKVKTLREVGWSLARISEETGFSRSSIHNICMAPTTPKKRDGRPNVLDAATQRRLVEFVQQSLINRRMSYMGVALHCGRTISLLYYYFGG